MNKHHSQHSTYFKEHFKSFIFEKRIEEFKNKDAIGVFVAKENSDLIGYCIASLKEQSGELDSIFIDPIHRNKKVGESLVEKAESWLKEKGAVKIIVCVAEGNESAFGFYSRQGIYRIGKRSL